MAIITYMKYQNTGKMRKTPLGFSWITLLFGFIIPLIRGHLAGFVLLLGWFLLSGAVQILVSDSSPLEIASVTVAIWLVHIVIAFKYNAIYARFLIRKGFVPCTNRDRSLFVIHGILFNTTETEQEKTEKEKEKEEAEKKETAEAEKKD